MIKMPVKGDEEIAQDPATGEQESTAWSIRTGCGGYGEGLSAMPSLNATDAKENGGEELQSQAKDEVRDNLNPEDVSAKLETANLNCLVIIEPGKQIAPALNCGVQEVLGESLFCDDGDLGYDDELSDMPSHNRVDAKENGGEELQSEAKDEIRDNLHPGDVSAKLETANLNSLVNTEQKLYKEQDLPSGSQLKSNDGNRIAQMQGECDADNNEIENPEEGRNRDVGSSSSLFGTLPCQALEDWSRNYSGEFRKGGEIFEAGHLPESGGCQSDDAQVKSNLETHDHSSGIQDTDMTVPHTTQALDSVGIVFSWGSLIGHGEFVLNQNAECQDEDEIGHDTEASRQGDEIGNSSEKILLEGGSGQTDESFNGVETKEIKVDFPTAFTAEDLSAHFTKLELQTDKEELPDDKQKDQLATRDNNEMREVFSPLSWEAESAVNKALGQSRRDEVLVFHRRSNIEVTRAVMQCLRPGSWLNDEVINVYMELLKERELREPKKVLKCHFFNTFFYNKLFKNSRTYDYQAVQRWTTHKKLGYSLLECDKILIPIHQDVHWCLAVIDVRTKQLQYLDSLQGRDKNVLPALARYIVDESRDKAGEELDVSTWEHIYTKNIPKQHNGCDCGMFMLKYADLHSRGAPIGFTQAHMNYFRRRTVWEILQLSAT